MTGKHAYNLQITRRAVRRVRVKCPTGRLIAVKHAPRVRDLMKQRSEEAASLRLLPDAPVINIRYCISITSASGRSRKLAASSTRHHFHHQCCVEKRIDAAACGRGRQLAASSGRTSNSYTVPHINYDCVRKKPRTRGLFQTLYASD